MTLTLQVPTIWGPRGSSTLYSRYLQGQGEGYSAVLGSQFCVLGTSGSGRELATSRTFWETYARASLGLPCVSSVSL